jgi:hypothetical protein
LSHFERPSIPKGTLWSSHFELTFSLIPRNSLGTCCSEKGLVLRDLALHRGQRSRPLSSKLPEAEGRAGQPQVQ